MNRPFRTRTVGYAALTALCFGTASTALVALPLQNVAQAKGNDHGGGQSGDHGHGSGNGVGGGNAGDHGAGKQNGQDKSAAARASGEDRTDSQEVTDQLGSDDGSLSASGLGKLNGFFHASPNALANASPNSSIGRISHTFSEALSAYAEAHAATGSGTDGTTDGTAGTPTGPTVDDLGAILAGATNKPVTAAQVQAIAERLAEANPDDTALHDFANNPDGTDLQDIADAANAAHNRTPVADDQQP